MIPLIKPIFPPIETYIDDIKKIYESSTFSNNGPFCKILELRLAELLEVKHAILVTNGTMALYAALMSYNFEKGSRVLVPNFTFAATVQSLYLCGLEPVFADIDRDTLTMSVSEVIKNIDSVDAVLAVNSFGNPCHYMGIKDICNRNGVPFIVDAAGGLGSFYLRYTVGGIADIECFSLHATKVLPMGEGGLVTTNDDDKAEYIRRFKNFGLNGSIIENKLALNAKVDEFRCVIALSALNQLGVHLDNRKKYSLLYKNLLANTSIRFQQYTEVECFETNQLFPILLKDESDRNKVIDKFKEQEIGSKVYYTPFDPDVRLPRTDDIYSRILCLPMHSIMDEGDIHTVCKAVLEAIDEA